MDFNLAPRNIACGRVRQGLLGYMNCDMNMGLEMKWALKHTEIGHFSIIGSLFEQLQWTWSTLGHEMLMENNCSEWAFWLYLINDRSSKRDKNWTVQKFIKNQHTTHGVFWVLGFKILKCSQLLVLFYIFFYYFNLLSQWSFLLQAAIRTSQLHFWCGSRVPDYIWI